MSALAEDTAPSPGAVLFDMDGLLVETESTWYTVEVAVTAGLGGTWSHQHQEACLGSSLPSLAAYIVRHTGTEDSADEVARRVLEEMVSRLRAEPVHWQPGAQALLAELRSAGIPTALVSASYRVLVDAVLAGIGPQLFDVTVAGDEVSRTKPDPEPYVTAAAALDVPPHRCVVLEDSPNGATAGVAAGCHTVLVPSLPSVTPPAGAVVRPTLERLNLAALVEIVAESRPAV